MATGHGNKNWRRKMGKRLSKDELEARAIARDHTCGHGCGKGCSGFKDEPADPNEKLDRVTASEIRQQQQGMDVYTDPAAVLIYYQMVQSGEIDPGDEEQGDGVNNSQGMQMF